MADFTVNDGTQQTSHSDATLLLKTASDNVTIARIVTGSLSIRHGTRRHVRNQNGLAYLAPHEAGPNGLTTISLAVHFGGRNTAQPTQDLMAILQAASAADGATTTFTAAIRYITDSPMAGDGIDFEYQNCFVVGEIVQDVTPDGDVLRFEIQSDTPVPAGVAYSAT